MQPAVFQHNAIFVTNLSAGNPPIFGNTNPISPFTLVPTRGSGVPVHPVIIKEITIPFLPALIAMNIARIRWTVTTGKWPGMFIAVRPVINVIHGVMLKKEINMRHWYSNIGILSRAILLIITVVTSNFAQTQWTKISIYPGKPFT